MNINPLVSVIIPNYNYARYLKQRLDSVFNQTYQNFEVIILDDCSTDNSLEIIEEYKFNPHVSKIVVNEVNSGSPFKQWNKGFGYAKGELIWIAESDDYCELNFLEEMVKAFSVNKNVVLSFSSYVYVDDDGGLNRARARRNRCFNGKEYVCKRMSMDCYVRNASGVVFGKKVLDSISNDYLTFEQCGDYLFWTLVMEQGNVACVNKNLAYYRIHNGSVTSKNIVFGISAMEDKKVYDYINGKYQLSWIRKQIVKARRFENYNRIRFVSEDVREKVFNEWGITHRPEKLDAFLLWFVGSVQRHLGILI